MYTVNQDPSAATIASYKTQPKVDASALLGKTGQVSSEILSGKLKEAESTSRFNLTSLKSTLIEKISFSAPSFPPLSLPDLNLTAKISTRSSLSQCLLSQFKIQESKDRKALICIIAGLVLTTLGIALAKPVVAAIGVVVTLIGLAVLCKQAKEAWVSCLIR